MMTRNKFHANPGNLPPGPETILLVDDDPTVRNLAANALRRNEFTVYEAGGGPEAMRVLSEIPQTVHLLITDVVMQGMSGRELAARLQADFPQMRVLFITGWSEDPELKNKGKKGSVPLLLKPFQMDTLVAKVREILES